MFSELQIYYLIYLLFNLLVKTIDSLFCKGRTFLRSTLYIKSLYFIEKKEKKEKILK